ncbi:unnamed protein product [Camellia sinensis]
MPRSEQNLIQISLSQPSPSNPKFSRFQSSDSFGDFEVLSDSFGDFKVLSDSFGDFEVLSDSFGDFEVLSDSFGDSISDSFGDFEVLSISKLGDSISDSFSEESEHHHLPSVRLWYLLLNGIAERFDWDKIMGGDNIIGLKQDNMEVRCVITFVSLSLHDLMGDLILVKSGAGVQQCLSFKDAEACWCHMGDMFVIEEGPTAPGAAPTAPTSTVDAYEKLLSSIPEFSSFGKLFKSSAPVELTEAETEYAVNAVQHIFDRHVVFQYNCTNSIPEQLLENVTVVVDASDTEKFTEVSTRPLRSLPYDSPGQTFVVFEKPEDILHFKQLLNENPSLLLKLTPHENTPLHIATQFGHKNIVAEIYNRQQFLLAQPNLDGDTPLHVAARAGRISIVSFLVNELLSLSYGDIENRGNRETEILRMRNKWGNTVLHEAVRNHNLRVAEFLIKVDPELACFENNTGESPLYLAARDGMLEIVKRILMAACYSAYGGSDGQTALHATIVEGNFDAMEALVRAKPELIKEADHHGRTPLYYAASMGDHRTVQRLLQLHTDIVYMSDQDGLSPLHVAAYRGHTNIIQEIIQCCPDSGELLDLRGQNRKENGFIFGLFLDLSKPIKNNNNTTPKKAANLLLGKQQRLVSTNTDEELKM